MILIDGRMPQAASLVSALRNDPATRTVSLVAISSDDLGASDLDLLQSGVNAILHLPS